MVNILWFLYRDLPQSEKIIPCIQSNQIESPEKNWPAEWLERTERCLDSAKIKSNILIHEIRWVFWRCHHHEHYWTYWIFQIAAHLWLTAILHVDIYRRLFTNPPLRVSKLEMEGSHLQSLFNKTALFRIFKISTSKPSGCVSTTIGTLLLPIWNISTFLP